MMRQGDARRDWECEGDGDRVAVLYVDDEPALLDIAKEFLEAEGDICVDTSTSALRVLKEAASRRYDVIVSDYLMPEMDGLDFLKQLREGGLRTPFVLFTGKGREEVAGEALNSGADFYLQKGGDPVTQFGELRNICVQLAHRRRAEEALVASEEQLRLITDHMRDMVVKVDQDDIITYVSPSVWTVTGVRPEDARGRSIWEYVHPEDTAGLVETAARAVERREALTAEYRQRCGDGSYIWVEAMTTFLFDAEGAVTTSVFCIRSVEERRRIEEELRRSERRYRGMIENSNVMALRMDGKGDIIWMNEFAQRYFGYTEEEVLGKNVVGTIVPEVEEGTGRDLRALIAEVTTQTLSRSNNINQNIKSNGERIWVAWTNHLMEEDGPVEIISMGVDITSHHRSMEETEAERSLMRSVLESTLDAIAVVGRGGKVVTYNHRFLEIWGLEGDYRDRDYSEMVRWILPQLESPEAFGLLGEELRSGMEGTRHHLLKLKDGHRYDLCSNPHFMEGKVVGRVWSIHDHTQLLKTQDALAERESRFKAVFNNSTIGISLVDDQGHFLETNEALRRTIGSSAEVLKGDFIDNLTPEEAAEEKMLFQEMVEGKRDSYVIERRFRRMDGEIIWMRVTASAIREVDGRLRFAVGFISDITGKKEAEENLKRSEERYRALARNIPNGIVMLFDRDLRYTLVEGKGLASLKLNKEGIEGRALLEALGDRISADHVEEFRRALEGEMSIVTIGNDERSFQAFIAPLFSDEGETYGGMVLVQDITDLKRTEEQLRHQNRPLRILSAGNQAQMRARDEHDLYHRVCQAMVREGGYDLIMISLVDGDGHLRPAASCGAKGRTEECPPVLLDETGPGEEALCSGRIMVAAEQCDRGDENGGPRSRADVPLVLRGQTIGVLSLYLTRKDGFDEDELELLTEMTNDIVLGITAFRDRAERLRSEEALARQSEQLQLLAGSSWAISSELEEEAVMRRLASSAMDLVDCELGAVGRIVDGRLLFTEMNRSGEIVPMERTFIRGEGAPGRVMDTFRPLICGAGGLEASETPEGCRSMALVPLFDQGGGLNDILWMQDKRIGTFDDWDVSLLESLSSAALVAQRNAQVVHRLRAREGELEQANRKLDLIGRITLHDLLNQLTTLNGFLELGRRKAAGDECNFYFDKAIDSANRIANHIVFARDYREMGTCRPEWVPLADAVRRGAATIDLGEVALKVQADGVELYVDRMVEKVFHNLLDNSLRHGGVRAIDVTVKEVPSGLCIRYADDGKGVPEDQKKEIFTMTSAHHGLYLASEILALTGIRISETGREGEGARFEILVPPGSYRLARQGSFY